MKPIIAVASVLLAMGTVLGASGSAHADHHAVKAGPTITADGNFALPVGDLADGAGIGIGATGTFNFPLNATLAVTGRTGLIYHLPKNDGTFMAVPLLGGVKYSLKPTPNTVYISAEAGLYYQRISIDVMGVSGSDSRTKLGTALGAGYKMGKLDIKGGLQIYDLTGEGEGDASTNLTDSMTIFVTAGWTVAAL